MSDLISRKKICDYIKGKINPYGKPFEGTAYELGLKIMRYIDAMDSAYSVDKVIEELYEERTEILLSNDYECEIINYCIDNFDKAIKIVKQDDISNDVCECRELKDYNSLLKTSCGYVFGMGKEFKYCPYCGKKIKVVK